MILSPIRYQGSKRKLIKNILALVPKSSRAIDVFGGSGVVCANLKHKRRVYNDFDYKVMHLVLMLSKNSPESNLKNFRRIIKKYELDRTNEEGFFELRSDYNKGFNPSLLYVLHRYAHSNMIRHNSKNEFNVGFGKRQVDDWKLEQEIYQFFYAMNDVDVNCLDFANLLKHYKSKLNSSTFVYFDPPYLASGDMQYSGGWSEEQEEHLLHCLSVLRKNNVPFMLSNVLRHRDKENKLLIKWSKKERVKTHHIKMDYNLARAYDQSDNGTDEVLILG